MGNDKFCDVCDCPLPAEADVITVLTKDPGDREYYPEELVFCRSHSDDDLINKHGMADDGDIKTRRAFIKKAVSL